MDGNKTRLYKRLEFSAALANQLMSIVSSRLGGDEGGILRRQSDKFSSVHKCTVQCIGEGDWKFSGEEIDVKLQITRGIETMDSQSSPRVVCGRQQMQRKLPRR